MLAFARLLAQQRGAPLSDLPYIDLEHPIQKEIVQTFAEMCGVQPAQVELGIDGCSAPNFAVPLKNAALGFARLCDPGTGGVQPEKRREACRTLTAAMVSHPEMVGGPGRFDTELMRITEGRVITKAGAEGYQGVGLRPGVLSPDSPGVGITVKIGDGDVRGTVRCAVVLETLRQLGVLSKAELVALEKHGPRFPIHNWRKLEVGEGRPAFELARR
jgi:L-asparaginase II